MWKRRPKISTTTDSRVAKRVARLATPDLYVWSETCVLNLGRSLSEHQKAAEGFTLQDAKENAQALLALVEEIERRS